MEIEEVASYFLTEFRKMKIDDPTQRRLYEQQGPRQLKAFLESPAARPHGNVAMLEYSFACDLAGTRVKGRIDRVDECQDGYVIVDYKSGNPKSQANADRSLQLSVYAMALGADKPVKMLVFQNLEDNTTVETTRSAEDLRETETKIAKVAAGIAAGDFEPKVGHHCGWCAFRTICPEHEATMPPSASEAAESK
jgi:putative RecB family exonuclease